MKYIELSNGKVGYVENLKDPRFIADLKRLGLTYQMTTEKHYYEHMILTKLSPEQIYRQVGGKYNFEKY